MVNWLKNVFNQQKIRDFMLSAAFYLSLAALTADKAQAQTLSEPKKDKIPDKHKTSLNYDLTIGAENLSVLIVDEKTATFYNDLMPQISVSAENKRGDRVQCRRRAP